MRGSEQTRGLDEAIAELAGQQFGVVGRRQLLEVGVPDPSIDRRLGDGRLHFLHPGAYSVGHRAIDDRGRWLAAVLACGPKAVLSHSSAAALWGIRSARGGLEHVTTPRKARSTGSIRRHYSVLPADEVTEVEGIPVTTVPRTIFDLASGERPEAVEAALREVEYRQLYDRLSLDHLLDRYPRRRGAPVVRRALERLRERPGRVRRGLEERFMPFVDGHRLPRPSFNAWMEVGGHRYQADCLWPEQRLIVELDGWEGHRTRRAFHDDRSRDRRLAAAGYRIAHLTWAQLEGEPEAVAADLHTLLG